MKIICIEIVGKTIFKQQKQLPIGNFHYFFFYNLPSFTGCFMPKIEMGGRLSLWNHRKISTEKHGVTHFIHVACYIDKNSQ
jgi:hypothetical protein